MEDQDLREIGITDPSHRKKILHAARSLPKVTKHHGLTAHVTYALCISSNVGSQAAVLPVVETQLEPVSLFVSANQLHDNVFFPIAFTNHQ